MSVLCESAFPWITELKRRVFFLYWGHKQQVECVWVKWQEGYLWVSSHAVSALFSRVVRPQARRDEPAGWHIDLGPVLCAGGEDLATRPESGSLSLLTQLSVTQRHRHRHRHTDTETQRQTHTQRQRQTHTHTHTHTHTDTQRHRHTCWFLWFTGTLHRRNGFYTVQAVCAIALHLPYT